MAKAGYGNGQVHGTGPKTKAKGRNPQETSGKGGSYHSKKSAATPGKPLEVHKNKARRVAPVESGYNNVKSAGTTKVVRVTSDPSGTSHHPKMGNIFANLNKKYAGDGTKK